MEDMQKTHSHKCYESDISICVKKNFQYFNYCDLGKNIESNLKRTKMNHSFHMGCIFQN